MIEGVLSVSETTVRDIMIPRAQMDCVSIDDSPPEFMPLIIETKHSRFPVIGESKDDVWWVIEADGKAIGATGIHGINWLDANGTTGIVIGEKAAWGKGYATEAMQIRTRYAFRELNLHKLVTEVDTENEASRKALERNGYRTVGVRREQTFRDGKWKDRWLGEIVRDDWEKKQA